MVIKRGSSVLHRRGDDDMCGGSPLIDYCVFDVLFSFLFSDDGEIHRGVLIYTLVLPSVMLFYVLFCSCRGDYTGEEIKVITLVLPSLNRFLLICLLCLLVDSDDGEIHRVGIIFNSRSPSMNQFMGLFYEGSFLVHFRAIDFMTTSAP